MMIEGQVKEKVKLLMEQLVLQKGLSRYITLLTILDILSSRKDYTPLSSQGFMPALKLDDASRINRVCEHIFRNFRDEITLDTVAAVAFMNPSSFSRYFRQHTGKSFTDFIIEIRIGQACRMLIETEEAITSVIYDCGFRNQSNFNNFFRRKMGMTPLEYRKSHHQ